MTTAPRRRSHEPEDGYPCFFGCGNVLASKYDFDAIKGWDWFTEYAKDTMHFCPKCRKTRQADIATIKAQARVRPENYPRAYAVIRWPA